LKSVLPSQRWTVIIPQKSLLAAKGRLGVPGHWRRQFARAMLIDTVRATLGAESVENVFVVCMRKADGVALRTSGAAVLVHPTPGMNGAILAAQRFTRKRWPDSPVAVLPGDLPCLLANDVDKALRLASRHDLAFIPDASGAGTTLLTASPGHSLRPNYGSGSSSRHAAEGAVRITGSALDRVRRDVDELEDLLAAVELGCGAATRRAFRSWQHHVGQVVDR
jgi:2-phospho-L-lactate guanylyltransferase